MNPGRPVSFGDPGNKADYNIYIPGSAGQTLIKDSGLNSVLIDADVELDTESQLLKWVSAYSLPKVPLIEHCETDYFGNIRKEGYNLPGPFQALGYEVTLKLY